MQFFPKAKTLMVLALAASVPFQAIAQDQPQAEIKSDRGLTEDRPYTVFYPDVLNVEDDGSETTVITLRHPDAPRRADR